MKPLIYGYMRTRVDEPDYETCRRERTLRRFAEVEGFCFATIFYEDESGTYAAFTELLAELQRAEAHHLVIPQVDDLSPHPLVRFYMINKLNEVANASVHIVGCT